MAATGTISITGTVTDLPGGDKTIGPVTTSAAAAVSVETQVVLASGTNTITVPTGSTLAIVIFGSGSAVTKTLKGIAADTGIRVTPTGAFMLVFDSASVPASFVITASGADTGITTTVIFI